MSPDDTHIVSETVVEDGVLVSDYIFQANVKKGSVKKGSLSNRSNDSGHINKHLRKIGLRLLDMFVCNVDVD